MRSVIVVSLMVLLLSACLPQEATPSPSPMPFMCAGFVQLTGETLTCTIETATTTLFQTQSNDQVVLQNESLNITFTGTLASYQSADIWLIAMLEGNGIVSNGRYRRIVQGGTQVRLTANNTRIELGDVTPLDSIVLASSQLSSLDRPLTPMIFPTIIPETSTVTPQMTATVSGNCVPRSDWQNTYTIKAGDVLSLIASDYDLTVLELSEGNCLINPNRLRIGQVLRVPGAVPSATPSAIAFRPDAESIRSGECTTLRWDVFNVKSVFLNDVLSNNNDIQRVCPTETTTYTLRVLYFDDQETERQVTITVAP